MPFLYTKYTCRKQKGLYKLFPTNVVGDKESMRHASVPFLTTLSSVE